MSMTDDNPCIEWERMKEGPYSDAAIKWAITHLNDPSNGPEYAAWCRRVIEWVVADRGGLVRTVQNLRAQNESQGKCLDTHARIIREQSEAERAADHLAAELREKLDAAIAAHHACLAELATTRHDRDQAKITVAGLSEKYNNAEAARARLSRELINADHARDLLRQRVQILREKYLGLKQAKGKSPTLYAVIRALGFDLKGKPDPSCEEVVQRAEALVAVDRDAREWTLKAAPGIMRIRKALALPPDCTAEDMAEHVERLADVGLNLKQAEADLEYQRKEQGRLAKEVRDLGAELHEARRKLAEADETNRVCVDMRIKLAAERDQERARANALYADNAARDTLVNDNQDLKEKLDEARRYIGEMACGMPVEGWDLARARELVRAADERTMVAVTKRLAAEKRVRELEAALTVLKTAT